MFPKFSQRFIPRLPKKLSVPKYRPKAAPKKSVVRNRSFSTDKPVRAPKRTVLAKELQRAKLLQTKRMSPLQLRRGAIDDFGVSFQFARAKKQTATKASILSNAFRDLDKRLDKTPMPSPVAMDVMTKLSYVHLPDADLAFPITIGEDPIGILPKGRVQCQLVADDRQTLTLKDLASLPRDVWPGTGFQVWNFATKDGPSKKGIIFTGTNSVGPSRDGTLGHEHATGALANTTKKGVGFGVIPFWLGQKGNPLSQHLSEASFIGGHSLGAALAQEAMLSRLELPGSPNGWFASAPCLSRPCSEAWTKSASQMFFVGSSQDPVRQAGTWKFPGRELIASPLDLPISKGVGNSTLDGLFTQHGAEVPSLLWSRGDELVFTDRLATSIGEPFDGMLPINLLAFELADLGRPMVASKLFTGTSIEDVMRALDDYGLDEDLYDARDSGARGAKYAYAVHLTHELLGSELIAACYVASPFATLSAIRSTGRDLLEDPEAGMRSLVSRLPLEDVQITVHNDTRRILPGLRALNQQMQLLLDGPSKQR